jgi:hypothetical protein
MPVLITLTWFSSCLGVMSVSLSEWSEEATLRRAFFARIVLRSSSTCRLVSFGAEGDVKDGAVACDISASRN